MGAEGAKYALHTNLSGKRTEEILVSAILL